MKTYQASPSHSELCIPLEKPSSCPEASFLKLKEVFNGVSCPPIRISILGGGGGAQALPPSWLNIPGHRSCLDAYQAESHREWCKPIKKPNSCLQDVWDKLDSEFTGLTCPPPGECHAPKIGWTDCGIIGGGRQCDVCFSITFNDDQPGSDIMCMKGKQCVYTGNLINDGSYVAVTASLQCTPELSDPLSVRFFSVSILLRFPIIQTEFFYR